ncbi:hypothetical protein HYW75_03730 [Candidatus Pacearchaeota archaeon]|nr:hypothetical protein [Candidatus Pacearchaeota archaeon]
MRNRKMRRDFAFFIIAVTLFVFVILPSISAEILLGQSKYLYNVGDSFIINVTLIPGVATDGFMTSKLICPNGDVEIYRSFYSLNSNEQKVVDLSILFGNSLLGDLVGNCYVNVLYGNDDVKSRDFIITKDIDISLNIVGASFDPGKEINVKGSAKKKNGQLVEGFVEAKIEGLNQSIFASTIGGNFNFTIPLSGNVKSGNYGLEVRVYEKDSLGVIMNEGSAGAIIKITQVVEKIDIAIDSQEITPGNVLIYKLLLFDQAGLEVGEDASIVVYRPNGNIYSKKLVKSGEFVQIPIALNTTPGYWNIEGIWEGMETRRSFYVKEIENASMNIENQTLIISNVGNVPYRKTLEIFIGNDNELKEINLDVGETKKYRVSAKDGEYEIRISDGLLERNLGKNYLTGNAVDIREVGSQSNTSMKLVIWIIILLILVFVAFNLYRKIKKNSYLGREPSMPNSSVKEKTSSYEDVAGKLEGTIISGKKELLTVIVLKIKNLPELLTSENNALPAIERAIQKAKDTKGRVYEQGEYKTIILSPSFMGGEEVIGKGLTLAEDIRIIIEEYNKYYALKINYGIGMHNGEMIIEKNKEGKIKFTAVGGTTLLAKRASDRAQNCVYLTEIVHRKMLGKIKSEKISNEGFWKLNQILRRDEHKDFINKFMKKQSDERARKAGFVK